MNSETKISIKSYRFGGREVATRDEANFVEIERRNGKMIDYLIISKSGYDRARKFEKPCQKWEQLPETV